MLERWCRQLVAFGKRRPGLRWPAAALLALLFGAMALRDAAGFPPRLCRERFWPQAAAWGRAVRDRTARHVRAGAAALRADLPALRRHAPRRAIAGAMTACLALSLLPVGALGREPAGSVRALTGAPEAVQTAMEGRTDSLDLPEALSAIYSIGTDTAVPEPGGAEIGGSMDVPVQWEGLPHPAVKGTYTLTAQLTLPEGFVLAEGVTAPTVDLTLTPDPEAEAVREMTSALPTPEEVSALLAKEDFTDGDSAQIDSWAEAAQAAQTAYEALTPEQQALLPEVQGIFDALTAAFRGEAATMLYPLEGYPAIQLTDVLDGVYYKNFVLNKHTNPFPEGHQELELTGTAAVKGTNTGTPYTVTIPEMVQRQGADRDTTGVSYDPQAYYVYYINEITADAFNSSFHQYTNVVLPSTIKTIGDSAFKGCKSVDATALSGDALASAGNKAFADTIVFVGYGQAEKIPFSALNANSVIVEGKDSFLAEGGTARVISAGGGKTSGFSLQYKESAGDAAWKDTLSSYDTPAYTVYLQDYPGKAVAVPLFGSGSTSYVMIDGRGLCSVTAYASADNGASVELRIKNESTYRIDWFTAAIVGDGMVAGGEYSPALSLSTEGAPTLAVGGADNPFYKLRLDSGFNTVYIDGAPFDKANIGRDNRNSFAGDSGTAGSFIAAIGTTYDKTHPDTAKSAFTLSSGESLYVSISLGGTPPPENKITSFSLGDHQSGDARITNYSDSGDITVYMKPDTAVTNLTPAITVSDGASVSPVSGAAQDFTNPVKYTVTSSDGAAREYIVHVTVRKSNPPTVVTSEDNHVIYANGGELHIVEGDRGADYTNILYDADSDGVIGSGEYLKIGNSEPTADGYDLRSYTVYGGGKDTEAAGTKIVMTGGQIGAIYGGGQESGATVTGDVSVTLRGGKFYIDGNNLGSLYGGGRDGAVGGSVYLAIENTTVDSVYGGGYNGTVGGSTSVVMTGGTVENIYGGGRKETAIVTGNAGVTITGGTVERNVYGGGSLSSVTGDQAITLGKSPKLSQTTTNGLRINGTYGSDSVGNGVDVLHLSEPLTAGAAVGVMLPDGFEADGIVATGAVSDDLSYIKITKGSVSGRYLYLDGTDIRYGTLPASFTVAFDSQGGGAVASVSVLDGRTAGMLPTPTKSGFRFDGWYTAQDGGGNAFTSDTPVTGSIIVYANWTAKSADATISAFSIGGHAGVIDDGAGTVKVTLPQDVSLSSPLQPEIVLSSRGASIAPSDGQWQDFSNSEAEPVPYTVTAENGVAKKVYHVTVMAAPPAVTNWEQFKAAVTAFNTGGEDATITVGASFDFEETLTISAADKTLTITSDATPRTLTRKAGLGENLFFIAGAELVLKNITLDGKKGYASVEATSLVRVGSGAFTMEDGAVLQNNLSKGRWCQGGAVYNSGTFTMNGGKITGNETTDRSYGGGGVYNDGTFTMNGGEISGNIASNDDGSGGGVYNDRTFTMNGGEISGNIGGNTDGSPTGSGKGSGGGVYNDSIFTMTGGSITGNQARLDGGGVYGGSAENRVSGGAVVKDNLKTYNSTTNNFYLSWSRYLIKAGDFTQDADIHVALNSLDVGTYVLRAGEGQTVKGGDASYFASDNAGKSIYYTTSPVACLMVGNDTPCTCTVSAPTFAGGAVTILSAGASATVQLAASGSVLSGGCALYGHSGAPVDYTYEIKTDDSHIASIAGNQLTVTDAGTVVVTATAMANGKTATADAVFTVTKNTSPTGVITIAAGDGTGVLAETGGDDLSAALQTAATALEVTASKIKTLTITGGELVDSDWITIKDCVLTDIAIEPGVTITGDMPQYDFKFRETLRTASLPGVTNVGDGAFSRCGDLTTVSIPDVKTIGQSSFESCYHLTSITLSQDLESIGIEAFKNCSRLEDIAISAGVTAIGKGAFQYCKALTSIAIPGGVTALADDLFGGCGKLAELKLGAAIPTVGTDTFKDCPKTRALTLVDANGAPLTGTALTNAQEAYDTVADNLPNSTGTDGLWYGWRVREAAPAIITFDSNGGTTVAPVQLAKNTICLGQLLPAPPTREGKVFIGWRTARDGGGATEFTANTPVEADITVYASWVDSADIGTLPAAGSGALYANGSALVIERDDTGAAHTAGKTGSTIYLDLDRDGVRDPGEPSMQTLGLTTLADGADLSNTTVYGGAAVSDVESTKITLNGGEVQTIYGGFFDHSDNKNPSVNGPVELTINGGKVAGVYGGGEGNNAPQIGKINGDIAITVNGGEITESLYGGNYLDRNHYSAVQNISIHMTGGTIAKNLCGGSYVNNSDINDHGSDVLGTITITLDGGQVLGNLFGGGMYDHVGERGWSIKEDKILITINKGTVSGNVYGGCSIGTVYGNAKIKFAGGTIEGDLYGGGYNYRDRNDESNFTGSVDIAMTGGTVNNIYGGSAGENTWSVAKKIDITITGGQVLRNVYGGGGVEKVSEATEGKTITVGGDAKIGRLNETNYNFGFGIMIDGVLGSEDGDKTISGLDITNGRDQLIIDPSLGENAMIYICLPDGIKQSTVIADSVEQGDMAKIVATRTARWQREPDSYFMGGQLRYGLAEKDENPDTAPVTGVTVAPVALTLAVGESGTLTASVQPNNAAEKGVTWSSGNPAVATVDANGKVTALAAGTAVVTAASVSDGGKSGSATVTVSEQRTGGVLKAPLTQEMVDEVFGPGSATLQPDGTIKIEQDVTLDEPVHVETDVTIDLGGHTINGTGGETGADGKPSFIVDGDSTLTITGGGSIHGGDGGGNPGGTGGSGAPGVDVGGGGLNVGGGSEITGGNGGSGETGGDGGNGVTGGDGSDVVIGGGGSATGGNGGGGSTGSGGAGGDGTHTGGDTTVSGGGSATGGNGGSGATGGDGGNGSTGTGSGNITVGDGGTVSGGSGSGTGSGGSGAETGGGDINIGSGGSATGGDGGNAGGNGGSGTSAGDGGTTVGGSVSGGSATGGNGQGGSGSESTGSGDITVGGGGSVTGGSGSGTGSGGSGAETGGGDVNIGSGGSASGGSGGTGDGFNPGGNGGAGTSTGSGNTTVDGSVTGGSGGNGADNGGSGNGGNGGGDAHDGGTIGGGGVITGGNGGNIPEGGSGTPGSGGDAIEGGGSFPGGTAADGKQGLNANAKVDVKPNTPAVTVPEEDLIDGAVTDDERAAAESGAIIKIDVTLTVEKKDRPADKETVDSAVTSGQTVGVYLDIVLEKTLTKDDGATETASVSQAVNPIAITVEIPADMRGGSGYRIIRVHNGVPTVILPQYNALKFTLRFETDQFSTYAIAYTPAPVDPPVNPPVTPDVPSGSGGSGGGDQSGYAKPTPPQTPELPFADVQERDWFYDGVAYVYENGLMNGTGDGSFSPYGSASRGMLVTVLWRLEGEPEANRALVFSDVADGAYCARAVAWAAENGIVNGYGDGSFGPGHSITRQQLAAVLYRYAQYKGMDTAARGSLSGFDPQPSSWASEAVQWAVGSGVFSGISGGYPDLPGTPTRGETAVVLQNLLDKDAQ